MISHDFLRPPLISCDLPCLAEFQRADVVAQRQARLELQNRAPVGGGVAVRVLQLKSLAYACRDGCAAEAWAGAPSHSPPCVHFVRCDLRPAAVCCPCRFVCGVCVSMHPRRGVRRVGRVEALACDRLHPEGSCFCVLGRGAWVARREGDVHLSREHPDPPRRFEHILHVGTAVHTPA